MPSLEENIERMSADLPPEVVAASAAIAEAALDAHPDAVHDYIAGEGGVLWNLVVWAKMSSDDPIDEKLTGEFIALRFEAERVRLRDEAARKRYIENVR